MKRLITLWILLLAFTFYGCKKDKIISGTSVSAHPFFDSAVQYLKSTLSQSELTKLDFEKTKTLIYNNQNFGVQIFQKANVNKFILLQNQQSKYSGNWVDMSDFILKSSRYTSGTIILNSLDRSCTTKLKIDSNIVTKVEKTYSNDITVYATNFKKENYNKKNIVSSSPDTRSPVLPEIIIYYDVNGGSGVNLMSWYWLVDQVNTFSYDYFSTGGGGGASGGGGGTIGRGPNNIVIVPKFFPPDAPIKDLNKELKCFTDNNTSTYDVTVNINQPDPGTRNIVNPLSDFPVGHTFLTLEQHNADGTSIIRTIGFYPRNSVKPGSETDQSVFGDDSYTPYDVSLDFKVTGGEMARLIDRVLAQQAIQYDLNNFNCTNAAMDALQSININLPSTKSDATLFNGNDPGDLGEDVKGLNLTNFSAQNGNRKITRTVSNSNNQYSKGRAGGC